MRKKPKNKDTKAYEKWEISKMKRRVLRLWKEVVKIRALGRCEVCGKTKMLQSHHIEDFKLCPALRYDIVNGVAACPKHHKLGKDSFHRSFIFPYEFLKDRPLTVSYLCERRNDNIEITKEWLQSQIERLENLKSSFKVWYGDLDLTKDCRDSGSTVGTAWRVGLKKQEGDA